MIDKLEMVTTGWISKKKTGDHKMKLAEQNTWKQGNDRSGSEIMNIIIDPN